MNCNSPGYEFNDINVLNINTRGYAIALVAATEKVIYFCHGNRI